MTIWWRSPDVSMPASPMMVMEAQSPVKWPKLLTVLFMCPVHPPVVPFTTGGAGAAPITTGGVTVAPITTGGVTVAPIMTGCVNTAPLAAEPLASVRVTATPLITVGVTGAPLTVVGVTAAGSTSSELLSSMQMGESLPCRRGGLSHPVVVSSSKIFCSKVTSPDGPANTKQNQLLFPQVHYTNSSPPPPNSSPHPKLFTPNSSPPPP